MIPDENPIGMIIMFLIALIGAWLYENGITWYKMPYNTVKVILRIPIWFYGVIIGKKYKWHRINWQ